MNDYFCPVCKHSLGNKTGGRVAIHGITLFCWNDFCTANENVEAHGSSAREAYERILHKWGDKKQAKNNEPAEEKTELKDVKKVISYE